MAVVVLAVVGCAQTVRKSSSDPASGATSAASVPASREAWREASGNRAWAAAQWLSNAAVSGFRGAGVQEDQAGQLGADVRVVFGCMMAKDFEQFDRLMAAKGCAFNAAAGGWARSLVEEWETYPPEVNERLKMLSTRERLKYAWEHPAERHLEWQSFDEGSVLCGVGLTAMIGGRDWPENVYCSQDSLYSVPGERYSAADVEKLESSKIPRTAWCQCVGRFSDGSQRRVRVFFYYNEKKSCWMPIRLLSTPDGEHECADAII